MEAAWLVQQARSLLVLEMVQAAASMMPAIVVILYYLQRVRRVKFNFRQCRHRDDGADRKTRCCRKCKNQWHYQRRHLRIWGYVYYKSRSILLYRKSINRRQVLSCVVYRIFSWFFSAWWRHWHLRMDTNPIVRMYSITINVS